MTLVSIVLEFRYLVAYLISLLVGVKWPRYGSHIGTIGYASDCCQNGHNRVEMDN